MKSYSAGMFISITFISMIPEMNHDFEHIKDTVNFNFGNLTVVLTLLLMYFLDVYSHQ